MMAYAIVVARYLGPEDYGYFATGYSLVGLWSFVISMGMDTWLLQKSKNTEQTKKLSGEILIAKLLIFIIWAPLLTIGINRINSVAIEFLIICVFDILFDSMSITLIYGLNIQQDYHKVASTLSISRLGRLISAIFLISLGFRNPILFAAFRFFFTLVGFVMALITLRPDIKIKQLEIKRVTIRELLPFGLSEMFAQVYIMADVSLLAILSGKTQVGLYSPATNMLSALFVIPNSLYLYLLPKFSKEIALHNQIPKREIIVSLLGFSLIGLTLFLGIVVSAEWFIPILLGDGFEQTKRLLVGLSPIIIFKSLQFGLIAIIVAAGLQKFRLVPQFMVAVINVILNIMFVPKLGAEGAVLAYNLSEFILTIGYGVIFVLYKIKRLSYG